MSWAVAILKVLLTVAVFLAGWWLFRWLERTFEPAAWVLVAAAVGFWVWEVRASDRSRRAYATDSVDHPPAGATDSVGDPS